MARKYKIFHNNIRIFVAHTSDVQELTNQNSISEIIDIQMLNSIPHFLDYTSARINGDIILHSNNPELAVKRMFKETRRVVAAGGVVTNEKNEFLLIFRRGYWDLPKGKLDKGETIAECAVREVKEETGIQSITLGPALDFFPFNQTYTLHTYKTKARWNIKPSYWFHMRTSKPGKLKPQYEEDIEEAIWVSRNQLESYIPTSYSSIASILEMLVDQKVYQD